MSKEPTAASLKETLTKIANMDLGVDLDELSPDDAVNIIVTMATEALNPKQGPSAMELKIEEVANFLMGDFKMVFASNDDIGDALNKANILSPAGKPWTRSNVSKIMVGVKDLISKRMSPEAQVEEDEELEVDQPVAPKVPAPSSEPELIQSSQPEIAEEEPLVETTAQSAPEIDADLAEALNELDGLDDLALAS